MDRLLTPAELEIMQIIWRLGETNVHAIRDALGDGRTYTTISTIVRILEVKGFVRARAVGKQHVYSATAPREAYARSAVRDLVDRLFGGRPGALVRTLVDAAPPSDDELTELRAMLEEKR